MKIKKWIRSGINKSDASDTNALMNDASDALDSAGSWDIMGDISFEGEDGKIYVGTVEFTIGEASADYMKDLEDSGDLED